MRTLTSFSGLADITSRCGEELFVTRALQERSFWDASKAVVKLKVDETTYMTQVKKFLHRLTMNLSEENATDIHFIVKTLARDDGWEPNEVKRVIMNLMTYYIYQ